MDFKIHILGGSGSGTTTLAKALARHFAVPHFDADDYYWESTDPPFTAKRSIEKRIKLLTDDLDQASSWVLSGSLVNWADSVNDRFTHVIFITLQSEVRLVRLRQRERLKFGSRLDPGGDMYHQHLDFIEWAMRYDEGGLDVRSKHFHDAWLGTLHCSIIKVSGDVPTEQQVQFVLRSLK